MQGGSMMRILLIEDHREIAAALETALALEYQITLAETGQLGLRYAKQYEFDAILLDLNLPDMPGLSVCEKLRAEGCLLPIIILSAESQVLSKIKLLDAGADDYLTKPFSLGELKARIRALSRTPRTTQIDQKILEAGELHLNTVNREALRGGQTIRLRRKEFAILECLMRHQGTTVSRQALGNYVWPDGSGPWTNSIDVHIKYLRDKIDRPFKKPLIQTVHGLGYRLAVPTKRVGDQGRDA
jgi:DNA-binding response OmpR family regulator